MKKFLFSLLFFYAASVLGQQFQGGIDLGLIGSQVTGDELVGFNKAGLKAGGYVNLALDDVNSLQMELNFIQKGSRKNPGYDADSNFVADTYLLRLNYVELPFHYRYQFKEKIMFEGGLSMGVLLHALELRNGLEDMPVPFNKYDLSGELGVFYSLLPGIQINVRYSYSILAVRPHYLGQTHNLNRGLYNEILGVSVYYKL